MSLENLVKTNQLQHHTTNPAEVQRLIAAAARNLADSRNQSVSDQTRFDAAYKTIMQCALLGLMVNGYRPSTTTPGHHQTMIQSLGLTLGVSRAGRGAVVRDAGVATTASARIVNTKRVNTQHARACGTPHDHAATHSPDSSAACSNTPIPSPGGVSPRCANFGTVELLVA